MQCGQEVAENYINKFTTGVWITAVSHAFNNYAGIPLCIDCPVHPEMFSKVLKRAQASPKSHLGSAGGVHQAMKLLPEAPQYRRVPGDFMRTLAVQPIVLLPAHKDTTCTCGVDPFQKAGCPPRVSQDSKPLLLHDGALVQCVGYTSLHTGLLNKAPTGDVCACAARVLHACLCHQGFPAYTTRVYAAACELPTTRPVPGSTP